MKSGLIILIPAYQPEKQLLSLLEEAKKDEFQILIVDDGSDGNSRQIFQSAVGISKQRTHYPFSWSVCLIGNGYLCR